VTDVKRLLKILNTFKERKLLVIGDIMLDRSIFGDVTRISPEAPVQVVHVNREENIPGGAANVANNMASLGGRIHIIGTVGDDGPSKTLKAELRKRSIITDYLIKDQKRPTIQKTRIMAQNQQLLRVDYEKKEGVGAMIDAKIVRYVRNLIKRVDAVVVSDYGKGIIGERVMRSLVEITKTASKPLIVDPKPQNMQCYVNADLVTPNHLEAQAMTGIEEKNEQDLEKMGMMLMERLSSDIIITRGEKGMSLFTKDFKAKHFPTKAKEVYDVTGAGDTVVATIAMALSSGATLEEAIILANHAAGAVVGKVGTATITVKEIAEDINNELRKKLK